MLDAVRDVVIPFMKRSTSRKITMDCATVYCNETIYKKLTDNGIEPYPSRGQLFDAEDYPPNSHDCMLCELIIDRLKEKAREAIQKRRKNRRSMKSL